MNNKRVLYLITARSQSKSIKNKNIKPLGGLELLCYRIKSAKKIADSKDIWLSTDSLDYAKIGEKAGATVPFIRPLELALDTTPSVDVVEHAMLFAENIGMQYDALCLLEPTVPFIPYHYLLEARDALFDDKDAENAVAVRRVSPGTFFIQEDSKYLYRVAENVLKNNGVKRRQDEPAEITPSGGFYFAKWEVFKKKKSFYTDKTLSIRVPELYSTEIDEPIDFLWCEFLLQQSLINLTELF